MRLYNIRWHIIMMLGIIFIMNVLSCLNVYAKTPFNREKVEGVMSTAVGSDIVVTWENLKDADGYELFEWEEAEGTDEQSSGRTVSEIACVKRTTKCKVILKNMNPGSEYHYYVVAYKISKNGSKTASRISDDTHTSVPIAGISTIKNLLRTAIAPIGQTMYVWGGGWNKADTAAGKEAKCTGLSSTWRSFAKDKKSGYNYRNYRYLIHKGLDCSGYVGWCVYNVLNTENGKKGYVYSASKQAKRFADLGMGEYTDRTDVKDYRPRDIMSSTCSCCGHVWIVIGECHDGSVVLAHASPPGVQLSGTVSSDGKKNSEAYKLAKKYMKKYYPSWHNRFPEVSKGATYLSHYSRMRWYTEGDKVFLSDPDGYTDMNAEKVLKDLFGE